MKNLSLTIVLLLLCSISMAYRPVHHGHGLQEYTLPNGLTVYLLEDRNDVDVCGAVVVRAGTVDEPDAHRGSANFLRFALMNGTEQIGSLDWAQERPIYEEIIRLYDTLSIETNRKRYAELQQCISAKSAEAAKYSTTNEYTDLMRQMGATDISNEVNADWSLYRSNFPATSMAHWLKLNSERFINPVFRNFQQSLNLFYEEYNTRNGSAYGLQSQYENSLFYRGTPYARHEIGMPEQLEHPSLTALIDFYRTWYVANNMALVLVGNFDTEAIRPLPPRPTYPAPDFSGNKLLKTGKSSFSAHFDWYFNGAQPADNDYVLLKFTTSLLSNNGQSGLIDRLESESNVIYATSLATLDKRDAAGSIIRISAIPNIGRNKTIETSQNHIKQVVFNEINKLKDETTISDLLFESTKNQYLNGLVKFAESPNENRAWRIGAQFALNIPIQHLYSSEQIAKITKADVVRCAQRYFSDDYLTINFENTSSGQKGKNINKPEIDTLTYYDNTDSDYARQFDAENIPHPTLPSGTSTATERRQIGDNAAMYYTPDTANDNFKLTLRYEYGLKDNPDLGNYTQLLPYVGLQPNISANALNQMLAYLGAKILYSASYNYTYIFIEGKQDNMEHILAFLTKTLLLPKVDESFKLTYWGELFALRIIEQNFPRTVNSALSDYAKYGDNSRYLNRSSREELYTYANVEGNGLNFYMSDKTPLESVTNQIISSPVTAYYCGDQSVDSVERILTHIPMGQYIRQSTASTRRPLTLKDETNIVLHSASLPNTNISFLVKMDTFSVNEHVLCQSFNTYFTNLITDELKTRRSVSFNPTGGIQVAHIPQGVENEVYFQGSMDVEKNRVNEAIDLYMNLLCNMPISQSQFKSAVRTLQSELIKCSSYKRQKGAVYSALYAVFPEGIPVAEWLDELKTLTTDDLRRYYESKLKDRPVTITINGNPRHIDLKQLEQKYGKIRRVGNDKLFIDKID